MRSTPVSMKSRKKGRWVDLTVASGREERKVQYPERKKCSTQKSTNTDNFARHMRKRKSPILLMMAEIPTPSMGPEEGLSKRGKFRRKERKRIALGRRRPRALAHDFVSGSNSHEGGNPTKGRVERAYLSMGEKGERGRELLRFPEGGKQPVSGIGLERSDAVHKRKKTLRPRREKKKKEWSFCRLGPGNAKRRKFPINGGRCPWRISILA